MKLILIVPSFPKLSETFIVTKFLGLLSAGWDVHIVCRKSEKFNWTYFPELGRIPGIDKRIHVTWPLRPLWLTASLMPLALGRMVVTNRRYLKRVWQEFGWKAIKNAYLDAEITALKPDIIHFEFGPLAVGRTYLKDILDTHLVVSFRGYDLNYIGLDQPDYYRSVWEKADGLHLLGEDLWQRAQCRGCPSGKFHALIAPAVDTDFFDPGDCRTPEVVGTEQRPLRLLSVGRLEWKKGYEYAVQAIRLLKDQGISCDYRILGGGKMVAPIAFARHQLELNDTIQLLGSQPRTEVKAHMEWADVFLHAAVSEGFCNAVMEAQSMQLPVVTSDADGLAENVADGETGFVVKRRNPKELAQRIQLLVNNSNLRQQFGFAGRKRVKSLFQSGDQIGAFDRFYRQLVTLGN